MTTWAMVSACWFKTDVRNRILSAMLDTFGKCASDEHPLFLIDGSPQEIAHKNKELVSRHRNVNYLYDPIEQGIDRMLHALRNIPHEYIVTVCDDFVLVGEIDSFVYDVRAMIEVMEQEPFVDAYAFYCAQLEDFQGLKMKFVQPILRTDIEVHGQRARLSICPRFFYNLGIHRRERLIESLEFLKARNLRTFRGAELNTLPNRVWIKIAKTKLVQKLFWKFLEKRRPRFSKGLYRTILLRHQKSVFYHLGEVESSVLDGFVRSGFSREMLLDALMHNGNFPLLLKNADVVERGMLVHC